MNKRRSGMFDSNSPSHHQMAMFKLTFHSPVSKELRCLLCSELMRDAVYTTCCDSFYCQECITRVQSIRRPCPKCNRIKFDIVKDNQARAMRAKINALRVYCPMSKSGCKWIGPLEGLDHHLKYGEATIGTGSGACQFLAVECPNKCGSHVARGEIPKHLRDRCNQRKVSCPHCGFTDTHDHVTAIHYSVCALFPVDCPNGCKMPRIQRKEVKDHIENKCPLRLVTCEFEFAGCPSEFQCTNESRHMEERTTYHLSLLSTYCLKLSSENEALRNICYQLQESCASLQSELALQKSTLKQMQLELWSVKLKLPQPLPTDKGEETLPPSRSPQRHQREHRDHIYSEPNKFTFNSYNHQSRSRHPIEHGRLSLPSGGFPSLNQVPATGSDFSSIPRQYSVPSLQSHMPSEYDKPCTRHQSSSAVSGKAVRPICSPPIPEVFELADPTESPPAELEAAGKPPKPVKPVKPDILVGQVVPPPVPRRPTKYANLGVTKRKLSNGITSERTDKMGSSHTLPASLPTELQSVFSTAETPIASGDEDCETEDS